MTHVTALHARSVRVPLARPIGFSTRRVTHRSYCLVRVEVSDGSYGIGFCYEGSHIGGLVAAAVRSLLAPLVVGQDPHRTTGLWDEMYRDGLLQGRAGAVMRAISAVDIALWDRNARACDLPLWRYLGSSADGQVPAYASGGYYVDGDPVERVAEEVAARSAAGFTAVKIKVGGWPLDVDAARVHAAREALGPAGTLMLDANNAWRTVPEALLAVRRFESADPLFIEEPFLPDDIDAHRRLAAATPVTIATGELEVGRWRARELIDTDGIEILQFDAAVCGGITEFRRIAAAASAVGKSVWPHWFHDLHAHLVGSIDNGGLVEFFADSTVLNFRELVDTQLQVRDGQIALPERPGLGFDFAAAEVDAHAVDSWA